MAKKFGKRRLRATGRRKSGFQSRVKSFGPVKLYKSPGFVSAMPSSFKAAVTWRYETTWTMDNSYRITGFTMRAFEPCRQNIATPSDSIIAGHVLGLMSIYAKCNVLKTSISYHVQSLSTSSAALIELVSVYLPYVEALKFPNNDGEFLDQDDFDRLRTMPTSKYHLLAGYDAGGTHINGTQMVDVQSFIGQPMDARHSCYATLTTDYNILNTPPTSDLAVVGPLPSLVLCARQNTQAVVDASLRLVFDVTNYCEFSTYRFQPGKVGNTKPWRINVVA